MRNLGLVRDPFERETRKLTAGGLEQRTKAGAAVWERICVGSASVSRDEQK